MSKIIFKRRSIRKFKDDALPDEAISQLLKAAMAAPSANNIKAWHFVVINKRELLDQLSEIHPYGKMLNQAAAAILVCGDTAKQSVTGYLHMDCAAATQNILLEATSLEIGSVWLGIYPREQRMTEISDFLNIPNHILPVSLVALGYPAEYKPANNPWQADAIHYNMW
ncbi:MAG: nitroreductase family protein [Bacteroidales bacterium]|nr:nitroreductase family protein [Bacteroidales bacterium]HOI32944.1 nitroreductase family protein [Bacteroidales bacterium]